MKRVLWALAAAALLGACSKGEDPAGEEARYGALAIDATCAADVEAVTRARVELPAGCPVPDWREMTMRIASKTGGFNYNRVWARVANYDPKKDLLLEGDYEITIFSTPTWHGVANIEEGADKPYFEGTATPVTVERRKQTPVPIRAVLANTIVKIEFTDEFKGYFANGATFTLTTAAGNVFTVGYTAEEKSVADTYWYVRPDAFTISGRATKQRPSSTADPETVQFADTKMTKADVKPTTLYTFRFGISGVGSTDGGVTITLNDEPIDTETIDEELNPDSHI